MFEKMIDSYEKNWNTMIAFIEPETVRKFVSNVSDANFALMRESMPAVSKFMEAMATQVIKV